jgi:hypothetical protein
VTIQTDPNSNWKLTEEGAARFATQLELAVQEQPEVAVLNEILLSIGGVAICAPMFPSREIPRLLDCGFLMSGSVKQLRMGRLGCWAFLSKLWLEKEVELTGIGTGLALNEYGVWVWHAWGQTGDTIMETECGGLALLKYFGRVLEGEEANQFARDNVPSRQRRLFRRIMRLASRR